jgi:hypothetical protein
MGLFVGTQTLYKSSSHIFQLNGGKTFIMEQKLFWLTSACSDIELFKYHIPKIYVAPQLKCFSYNMKGFWMLPTSTQLAECPTEHFISHLELSHRAAINHGVIRTLAVEIDKESGWYWWILNSLIVWKNQVDDA